MAVSFFSDPITLWAFGVQSSCIPHTISSRVKHKYMSILCASCLHCYSPT